MLIYSFSYIHIEGKGGSGSSASSSMSGNQSLYPGSSLSSGASSLASLSNMGGLGSQGSAGLGAGGLTSKDGLNAFLAHTMTADPQSFIKQQQKLMQCLPQAQRKVYENMLVDMEQAMKMT